jgi:hypothetical protein
MSLTIAGGDWVQSQSRAGIAASLLTATPALLRDYDSTTVVVNERINCQGQCVCRTAAGSGVLVYSTRIPSGSAAYGCAYAISAADSGR